MAVAGHILVRPEPCRAAAMPGQRLRHEIGKAPGRLRHDRQGHSSGLPVNRDHARERQPDFFGMAFSSLEIANLSLCQGMAFPVGRSEEHTSELQSLMRTSYDVFCLKKKREKILMRTI